MSQCSRLLVLPAEYPDPADPLEFNGSWAEEQTRAVSGRYQVTVVYPTLIPRGAPGVEEYRSTQLTTHVVRYRHIPKTWILSYAIATQRGLKVSGIRPDCIHAHGLYPAGLVAIGLGKWLGVPVVVTEHWGRLAERVGSSRLMALILPWVLRTATTVVAVSEALAAEMVTSEPRCRPVVVPNTVLPAFFDLPLAPAAPQAQAAELLQLLFVGSLHDSRKGLGDLLQAIALYARTAQSPRVQLSVVGDGQARAGYESLASKLGLGSSCVFLGNRTRQDVVHFMGSCHVLAVPSSYETFGVVFAEAMAAGKPVIACLAGAAEEVVPRWAGMLVPCGDHAALCSAIASVARNQTTFDGARSRSYAWDRYGPEAFLERMTTVYEETMRRFDAGER